MNAFDASDAAVEMATVTKELRHVNLGDEDRVINRKARQLRKRTLLLLFSVAAGSSSVCW